MAHLVPRGALFQSYVIAREIANELGVGGGPIHSEWTDAFGQLNKALLACLPDNQSRRKVDRKVMAILSEGVDKVCKVVISDATELRRETRKYEAINAAAVQKWKAENPSKRRSAQTRSRQRARTGKRAETRQVTNK